MSKSGQVWCVAVIAVCVLFMGTSPAEAVLDKSTDAWTSTAYRPEFGIFNIGPITTDTEAGPTNTTYDDGVNEIDHNISPGQYHGEAIAGFGTLKALVRMSGPSASLGSATATYSEMVTITDPTIPNGTAGSVEFSFNSFGTATGTPAAGSVNVDPADFVSVGVQAFTGDFTSPSRVQVLADFYTPLGNVLVPTPFQFGRVSTTDPIAFTYGTPFRLTVLFRASVGMDNTFVSFNTNTGFRTYVNHFVDEVEVDFLNSMEVSAVAISNSETATVLGQGGEDYSNLVVPEPGSLALLVCGGLLMLRRRAA